MQLDLSPIQRERLLEELARAFAKQQGWELRETKSISEFAAIADRNPRLASFVAMADLAIATVESFE